MTPGISNIEPHRQLTRDSHGTMQGVGGSDTVHQFTIGDGPQIDLAVDGLPHGPAVITYTVTDEDLESITLTVDDIVKDIPVGETTPISGTEEVHEKGKHKVILTAVDKAGNPPSEKTLEFIIDPTPQLDLTSTGPSCGPVVVSYSAADKDLETVTLVVNGTQKSIPVEGRTSLSGQETYTSVC